MDDQYQLQPIAAWYMGAAVASLILMGLFGAFYLMHVTADPSALPIDQRAAYEATPAWVISAFGVGAWVGVAGGILLILKRRQAEIAFLISLAGMLVWLAGSLAVAPLREAMSANDLLVIIGMVAIVWTIFWFARHSRQRGWLR
jgi:hypothetical protein